MDTTSLPNDWEINAIINFSAYNYNDDEYVTTQGNTIILINVTLNLSESSNL